MQGTLALFLREVDLTPEQRSTLDKVMKSHGFSRTIPLPDHPTNKEWKLPESVYYSPNVGDTPKQQAEIRDTIRSAIQGFFSLALVSSVGWGAGWVARRAGEMDNTPAR